MIGPHPVETCPCQLCAEARDRLYGSPDPISNPCLPPLYMNVVDARPVSQRWPLTTYALITAFCAAIMLLCMCTGCEKPTAALPDGQRVNAEQVEQMRAAEGQRYKLETLSAAKDAEIKLAEAKSRAEREMRKLAADGAIETAQRDKKAADIGADAALEAQRIVRDREVSALTIDKGHADNLGVFDVAAADIARQTEQRIGFANVVGSIPQVQAAAGSVGIGPAAIYGGLATLLGVGGHVSGVMSEKRTTRKRDESWDEAKRDAEAERNRARAEAAPAPDALAARVRELEKLVNPKAAA